jgi:CelD/BcsL family acetyltransferase involved in cellulose biosynthesis
MPEIQVIPVDQLCSRQLATWSEIQQADPTLSSPFFRPEYARTIASIRSDVQVAVLREGGLQEGGLQKGGRTVGFFPFQTSRHKVAQPIGGWLTEFQGIIAERNANWCAEDLVRGSGLAMWRFDHLLATQQHFEPFHCRSYDSPYMELRGGFEAYLEGRQGGQGTYRNVLRKARKIERELGPLRFEFHTSSPRVLDHLIQWKTAQYKRTKNLQILRFPWIVELLKRLQTTQEKQFAGVVSALYAGDQLIAAHHGIRSSTNLHIWFPAYDRTYEKFSPGLILLLRLIEAATNEGLERIDLGKGNERYKASFKTGDVPVVLGAVDTRPVLGTLRQQWQVTKSWIRKRGGGETLDAALRVPSRIRQRWALR